MNNPETDQLPEYPEETEGSRMARQTRKICNRLSNKEREELLRHAMRIIYSDKQKEQNK
jgi:uncharacterized tellurite resistance protein B-like protein